MKQKQFAPIAVTELDIATHCRDVELHVDPGYTSARVLLRWRARPLGLLNVTVRSGRVDMAAIRDGIAGREIADRLLGALADERRSLSWAAYNAPLLSPVAMAPAPQGTTPTLTLAVCTRRRPDDLRTALQAALAVPNIDEILVVDNDADSSARAVVGDFEGVRYVNEVRPGLDRARNRAIAECRTELLGFCDDDARLDRHWADQVRNRFAVDSEAGAVTGLVLAAQLDHEAQELFERTGGFRRGFESKRGLAERTPEGIRSGQMLGIGNYGVGTNMTFRVSALAAIGPFDEALDAGTIVGGAGDLDMLYRTAMAGYAVAYEPSAIVWHRHRATNRELARQLSNNGGVVAFLQGVLERFPAERDAVHWVCRWLVRYHAHNLVHPSIPRRYALAELYGYLRCWLGGHRARSIAAAQT